MSLLRTEGRQELVLAQSNCCRAHVVLRGGGQWFIVAHMLVVVPLATALSNSNNPNAYPTDFEERAGSGFADLSDIASAGPGTYGVFPQTAANPEISAQ
jgi:hypothetical protein